MAVVHDTTLVPSKTDLLREWLPGRPWHRGGGTRDVVRVGGFRLDDPGGEVGVEFMIVVDTSDGTAYATPLTYRGVPLDGADHALVGTMEHGVLGRRWAYDACHDPVFVDRLAALVDGRAAPQHQHLSDTPATDVTRACAVPLLEPVLTAAVDGADVTDMPLADGRTLRLRRSPVPGDGAPVDAVGWARCAWTTPYGDRTVGTVAVVL